MGLCHLPQPSRELTSMRDVLGVRRNASHHTGGLPYRCMQSQDFVNHSVQVWKIDGQLVIRRIAIVTEVRGKLFAQFDLD